MNKSFNLLILHFNTGMKGKTYWLRYGAQQLVTITDMILVSPPEIIELLIGRLGVRLLGGEGTVIILRMPPTHSYLQLS